MVRLKPDLASLAPKASWRERFKSLRYIWEVALLFLIVMGGIYAGVFTPTEGGAVGTFACFVLGFINRQLTSKGFFDALWESLKTSGMIYFMIIGAMIFSTFLTTSDIPVKLGAYIGALEINRWFILGAVLIVYVLLGFFMDMFGILLITMPILFPVLVTRLGFDPLVLGVLSVIAIGIGSITPPEGILVFAVYGIVRNVPMFTIFRGCMPFVWAMVACMVVIAAFPQISTLLPNLMMPYR